MLKTCIQNGRNLKFIPACFGLCPTHPTPGIEPARRIQACDYQYEFCISNSIYYPMVIHLAIHQAHTTVRHFITRFRNKFRIFTWALAGKYAKQ